MDKGLHSLHCNSQNNRFPKDQNEEPLNQPNMKCHQASINGSTEIKAELIAKVSIRFSNDIHMNLDLNILQMFLAPPNIELGRIAAYADSSCGVQRGIVCIFVCMYIWFGWIGAFGKA